MSIEISMEKEEEEEEEKKSRRRGMPRGLGSGYTSGGDTGIRSAAMRRGNETELRQLLQRIDGAGYPAYKDMIGTWVFSSFSLIIDHVQSDPFAPPSRARVRVDTQEAGFPIALHANKIRTVALCDRITREFWRNAHGRLDEQAGCGGGSGGWGSSKGGNINIEQPGQHVLERTSCVFSDGCWELRFTVALPAQGRSIEGLRALARLCDELPPVVRQSAFYDRFDIKELEEYILSVEDQEHLRNVSLKQGNLVAFIRNGAILPRLSGANDGPMNPLDAIPFTSPSHMEKQFRLPSGRLVAGMGIEPGVTLIVGGGFHGKSTVLQALEVGVYNHIPGDGREFVVTDPTGVKIRSEDGRNVQNVNISPFINNLPFNHNTSKFSTSDASGSTSQAANIMEAIEMECKLMLMDEDVCATNFMIRDQRMQSLVRKEKEPITPLIARIRTLYERVGVSTILVIGGAGDYFDVADRVVMMDSYRISDVTAEAMQIARTLPSTLGEVSEVDNSVFDALLSRYVDPRSISSLRSGGKGKVVAKTRHSVEFGEVELDLSCVEQIVDKSQARAIGDSIVFLADMLLHDMPVHKAIQRLEGEFDKDGLDILSPLGPQGIYARPRRFEISAALNRLRGAKFMFKQ